MIKRIALLLFIGLAFWSCAEDPEPEDCAGVEGGTAYVDSCGVCDDTPTNDCEEDCAGEWGSQNICGCTDNTATNYDSTATFDDESCEYDTTPPTLEIVSPNNGENVYGVVEISIQANDDNLGISRVELIIDNINVFTDSIYPYSYSWDTELVDDGSHSISARAIDNSENSTETSISVVVLNSVDLMVYESNKNGNRELYSIRVNGDNEKNLTNDGGADFFPEFSPDGTLIRYYSNRNNLSEIFIMDSDGTNHRYLDISFRINTNYFHGPTFSPDGQNILFSSTSDGKFDIYSIDTSGSNLVQLTDNTFQEEVPIFNPTGNKILFRRLDGQNTGLYLMNNDGTNVIQLTNGGFFTGHTFTPDGQSILFISNVTGEYHLYSLNIDGLSEQNMLSSEDEGANNLLLSSDGSIIIYSTYISNSSLTKIYKMNIDGTNKVTIYESDGALGIATLSNDDAGLYFTKDGNIYFINIDGTNFTPFISNNNFNYTPVLMPE